ncbi:hypothetical protein LTY36_04045 [Limosilactobacillus agrestis]|uniref:Uncharacterized protein n=1 Tax=Limosilactobacillus agrestis TaxID=2759748 RepID=A0ABS8R6F2_9LACO|nr:hypothetical protein [Limosilactobacillus agrestis]MBB1099590.1 hypothetical protein [Limosilactobacillus agrestis]MCD7127220.1 hypothetical protein [Limosilactobacillus agrestis]MCD7130359.1 hypothetical protein [Limosilactobacillus agrestis]
MNLNINGINVLNGYVIKALGISTRTAHSEYGNQDDVAKYPERVTFIVKSTPDGRNVGQRFSAYLKTSDGIELQREMTIGQDVEIIDPKITVWARKSFVNITVRAKGVDFK